MGEPQKQIVTKGEAIERGLTRYFTGKPCKRGHVVERYTSTRACVECRRERAASGYDCEHYRNNRERFLIQKKRYYHENKERILLRQKDYRKENSEVQRAISAKRRAAKLQRTTEWTDTEKIKVYYELTEPGLHVDHEIPLQGVIVSGLHVHQNLRVIPAEENLSKHNSITHEELDEIAERIMNYVRTKNSTPRETNPRTGVSAKG